MWPLTKRTVSRESCENATDEPQTSDRSCAVEEPTSSEPHQATLLPAGAFTYQQHASAFLGWCQQNGHVGKIEAGIAMKTLYPAMCAALKWEPEDWSRVAREIRKLLCQDKPQKRWIRDAYRTAYVIPAPEQPSIPVPRLPGFPKSAT